MCDRNVEADNPLRRPAKPDQPTPEVYQEETAKRLERENKERAFLSGQRIESCGHVQHTGLALMMLPVMMFTTFALSC